MVLHHTDKLSQTLQQPQLSSVEGHDITMLTVITLEGLQTENDFELFWQKVEKMKIQFDTDEPLLARKQKTPRRFEEDIAPAEFAASPKNEYRRVFFEYLGLAVMSIHNRFDQKGFKTFSNVEQLLFKACKGRIMKRSLILYATLNDFTKVELAAELLTLRTLYVSEIADEEPSVESIKIALLALSPMQRKLLGAVVRLFQLLVNECHIRAIVQCIASN